MQQKSPHETSGWMNKPADKDQWGGAGTEGWGRQSKSDKEEAELPENHHV